MEVGLVKQVNIDAEMRDSYLSYAMSVIVSRALPDARDGLKPVQRRILYAMHDMGLTAEKAHKKSARVVGEVLGKYHPHGDQSVYDAMVRMAQDFSMRYTLVDGQGNFGSVDGDAAAAMRYTEARTTVMGQELLRDIEKNTVDFGTNFDDSLKEPIVLPSIIPNLLVNGSSGIAVGMSTSIPPHNLHEVINALAYMLEKWDQLDDITVTDLMEYIHGPDFPTGGMLFRYKGSNNEIDSLLSAYATGRGRVTVRAKAHIEHMERNKSRIVITELPYQTNKTNLISRIADLHRDGKIEGLTDLRDESDRNGMRIIIETTRTVEPEDVLAQLFKRTPMESTFSIIMVALVNGSPRVLTLKQALRHYLDHRIEVVRRRSEYDLAIAKQRAHILEGLLVALKNLDEVIEIIRKSRTTDSAFNNLMKKFKLSDVQARAILDMQLRRLAALEQKKIQEEHKEKMQLIKRLETLLSTPEMMRKLVKDELIDVRSRFGDSRKTQIVYEQIDSVLTATDLLPDEKSWVMLGDAGTLSRTSSPEMIRIPLKPKETPAAFLEANTRDILYLFATDGEAIGMPVHQLDQSRELGEGSHWADMTAWSRRKKLATAVVRPPYAEGYLLFATKQGTVKRVRLEDLPGSTPEPFSIMNVPDKDELRWAILTDGSQDLLLSTTLGYTIRFSEDQIRPMGLPAGGVMGIKLKKDDQLIAAELLYNHQFIWSITNDGLAKCTPIDQYPSQGRNGQGVINIKLPASSTAVAAVVAGDEETQILIKSTLGSVKRILLQESYQGSRAIKPREIIKTSSRNQVVGAIKLEYRIEEGDEIIEDPPQQLSLLG